MESIVKPQTSRKEETPKRATYHRDGHLLQPRKHQPAIFRETPFPTLEWMERPQRFVQQTNPMTYQQSAMNYDYFQQHDGNGSEFLEKQHRQLTRWTSEEIQALKDGIQKHGRGNWLRIMRDPNFATIFKHRTASQLRAKFNNSIAKDQTNVIETSTSCAKASTVDSVALQENSKAATYSLPQDME